MVTPRPGTSGLGVVSVESDTLPRGLELFSQFLPSLPFYYIGQNLRQRPVGWSLARCPVGRPSQALWIFRVALQAPALSTDATMPFTAPQLSSQEPPLLALPTCVHTHSPNRLALCRGKVESVPVCEDEGKSSNPGGSSPEPRHLRDQVMESG